MHARTGALRIDADKVDEVVSQFESDQLPRFREASGYKGFTLVANRQTGEAMGISFWESEDDLRASEELGASARQQVQETGGGQGEAERKDWEVVIDDTV